MSQAFGCVLFVVRHCPTSVHIRFTCRERLKNEKQQLVDTVDSLAKRVRLLEQQSGTAAQDPWALVQQPTSTDSYSDTKNFLNDSPNMSPSATTPPKVLEILDVPAHTKRTTSAGSELDERTGNPFRGISRLVECNRCTQSTSKIHPELHSHDCLITSVLNRSSNRPY